MYARVYIAQVTVNQQTPDDDRDEVYFLVSDESQFGSISGPNLTIRVPTPPDTYNGNDYYGLHAGESAFDSIHPITLWEGWIDYGKFVSLATVVREQDGIPFISLLSAPFTIVGAILSGNIGRAVEEIGEVVTKIIELAGADHHDTVGGFTLVVDHQAYKPTFTWNAAPGISALQSAGTEPIAQFACTGSGASYTVRAAVQQWMQIDVKHSGRTLDVRGLSLNAGAPTQQFVWNGGNNQLWEIVPVDGEYVKIVARHSGQCLDVANASQDDGVPVNQFPWHGGYNQQWKIEPVSDGWNRIVNRNSGKCLDVRGASMQNQAIVQQFTCHNQDNQLWRLW